MSQAIHTTARSTESVSRVMKSTRYGGYLKQKTEFKLVHTSVLHSPRMTLLCDHEIEVLCLSLVSALLKSHHLSPGKARHLP